MHTSIVSGVVMMLYLLGWGSLGVGETQHTDRIPHVEMLEPTLPLGGSLSGPAYDLLLERVTENTSGFYVYQDANAGLNHGFPSGFFAGDRSGTRLDLIEQIAMDTSCVDDPNASHGCSTDPTALDRDHGHVLRITLPPLRDATAFAGLIIEEPEHFGVQPRGRGYDLSDATHVVLDVRSPTAGGVHVQFTVGGKNTDRTQPFPITATWTEVEVLLSSLRNPDTNLIEAPILDNLHQLFGVIMAHQYAAGGGTVLVDNVRFVRRVGPEDFPPGNPIGEPRLSFPLGNETFGVVPAEIHVVDDGDTAFSRVGDWVTDAASTASYRGDRHTARGSDGSAIARWRFENLQPRVYDVQATWAADSDNATNAPYELFDGTTPRVLTRVDQSQATSGIAFDGSQWQPIGLARIESGVLVVELSNDAVDNTVVADGVRLVPTILPDQATRNLTTIYESSLTAMSLLHRGTPEDLAGAQLIANTMLYALEHDNTAGRAGLPPAPDGSRGLRDAYSNGDIAWFNDQELGNDGANQGEVRLSGFSSDKRLCGPSGFCLVLDGAFGGNNAFGIMALISAYIEFGEDKY